MNKTRIVATVGPATDETDVMKAVLTAGANVLRFNFSHGTLQEQKIRLDAARAVSAELGIPVAYLMDTKGPEIRIKQFEDGEIFLRDGDIFTLCCGETQGDQTKVSVTYDRLSEEVKPGISILIDDGLIKLKVQKIEGENIVCEVINGGELKNNKSINLPDVSIKLPSLNVKDIEDIKFAIANEFDFIAASFVRTQEDVFAVRGILNAYGGDEIKIISKIENREGVNNVDSIIKVCDGLMIARGDLGVEIPPEEVPLIQKEFITKSNAAGIPVITATQMLDSMIRNPRPTRAEVADVANAVFDGSDAVMLSGETAAGKYPEASVKMMKKIVELAEKHIDESSPAIQDIRQGDADITNTITYASCMASKMIGAKVILTPTKSGYTSRMIAKQRPGARIIAVSDSEIIQRRLLLTWGADTLLLEDCSNLNRVINEAIKVLKQKEVLSEGDLVVVTAGLPMNVAGTTNTVRIEKVQ